MKKPTKGIVLFAVLAAMTAAVFTGCSDGADSSSSSKASSAGSAASNTTSQNVSSDVSDSGLSIPPVESMLPSMPDPVSYTHQMCIRDRLLALQEFQRSAAAGGNVGHLVGKAQLLDGRRRIAAADDGHGAAFRYCRSHCDGARSKILPLGYAHRAVPHHGARALDGVGEELFGLRADVKAHPAVRNVVGIHRLKLGVLGILVRDPVVNGKQEVNALVSVSYTHLNKANTTMRMTSTIPSMEKRRKIRLAMVSADI